LGKLDEDDEYMLENSVLFVSGMYRETRLNECPYPKTVQQIEDMLISDIRSNTPVFTQAKLSFTDPKQNWWYADFVKLVSAKNKEINI
jgi:hypothetical protein